METSLEIPLQIATKRQKSLRQKRMMKMTILAKNSSKKASEVQSDYVGQFSVLCGTQNYFQQKYQNGKLLNPLDIV